MLSPKNKGVGPEPCFMAGCLSRGGSLKRAIWHIFLSLEIFAEFILPSNSSLRKFYLFISFKSFKFYTLLQTAFHDQNTANIKISFDFIDEDKNGFISFEEMKKFQTLGPNNRQGIQDRLTNALASSYFETTGKYLHITYHQ